MQLLMGPFSVPAGKEVQLCQTMKLPNDEPIAVNRFEALKLPGSHHTIMFVSDKDFPDRVFPCWGTINFDDWMFVFDTQEEAFDWELPPGKAFIFKPHQQVLLQAHYQNVTVTNSPDGGGVGINLHTTKLVDMNDKSTPMFGQFTVNRRIELPPKSEAGPFPRLCEFNRDVHISTFYGHFHSRGVRFLVEHVGAPDTGLENGERFNYGTLYESKSWSAPPFLTSPSPELPGDGENGYLVGAGEALRFTCWYENNTDETIVFGSHAEYNEHCNLFFNYSISRHDQNDGIQFTCSNGAGGW